MKKNLADARCFCLIGLFLSFLLMPKSCLGSGYEFEGVGARQVSRAGAAIADSEDWTAIYWNPGNIIRSVQKNGREIGAEVFGGMAYGKDSNSLSNLSGVGAIFSKDKLSSPFVLGAVGTVFPVGEKTALGLGVYTPLLQGSDFQDASSGGTSLDFKASAGIVTANVSLSMELLPNLSAGGGINLLYGRISTDIDIRNLFFPGDRTTSKQDGQGIGFEGVLGLHYDPHPKWSLGAVYRTGSDITIKGDAEANSTPSPPLSGQESSAFTFALRHPPTSGIGLAYKPTLKWVLSLDFTQTWWSRFQNGFNYAKQGTLLTNSSNTFDWRNTWKIKFGARHKLSERTELLGGYSYDRYALDAGSTDFSTAIDPTMHRLSGGIARKWKGGIETIAGAIGGYGTRREGSVRYRLSGFQLMLETRYGF